jgi:hypothetical protein
VWACLFRPLTPSLLAPLSISRSTPLVELLEFQAKQIGLGTADSSRVIAMTIIECLTTRVQSLDDLLTLGLVVIVLR